MTERGPVAFENWLAANGGAPRTATLEYPLFTDARITGDLSTGLGPYRLLNAVSMHGVSRPAAVLQIDAHLDAEPSSSALPSKSDTARYHGGTVSDEVAALFSL